MTNSHLQALLRQYDEVASGGSDDGDAPDAGVRVCPTHRPDRPSPARRCLLPIPPPCPLLPCFTALHGGVWCGMRYAVFGVCDSSLLCRCLCSPRPPRWLQVDRTSKPLGKKREKQARKNATAMDLAMSHKNNNRGFSQQSAAVARDAQT